MDSTFADYRKAASKVTSLIDSWDDISDELDRQRQFRFMEVTGMDLREGKVIEPDEIYIPVRIADTNIRRETPQYIRYLTQTRRAVSFSAIREYTHDQLVKLEQTFTKVARYEGWETPFISAIDGMAFSGFSHIRVVFDPDFPGHFTLQHVHKADLIFSKESEDIQEQEFVIHRHRMTGVELLLNVETFDFKREVVEKLLGASQDNAEVKNPSDGENTKESNLDATFEVFEIFYRDISDDFKIKVVWFVKSCQDWLKDPIPFFMGRKEIVAEGQEAADLAETEYPFYNILYYVSEDAKILNTKGRAFLDEPDQEAASAILSAISTKSLKASGIYGAPSASGMNPDQGADDIKRLDIKIERNRFYNRPLAFTSMPGPDPTMLSSYQAIVNKNSNEQSNVNFAALNRKDSEKTATEIKAAQSEAASLSSVQVAMFAGAVRAIYRRAWEIFSNRVLQGLIEIDPTILPLFAETWIISSAIDTDIIAREERLNRRLQAWPVIAPTDLAITFLQDILRDMFPEDAQRYIDVLAQKAQEKELIQKLSQIVLALAIDPTTGELVEEAKPYANELLQLKQQTDMVLNGQTNPASQSGNMAQSSANAGQLGQAGY